MNKYFLMDISSKEQIELSYRTVLGPENADIVIPGQVSCVIYRQHGPFYIDTLNLENPPYLNKDPVLVPQKLHHEDYIVIGERKFVFEEELASKFESDRDFRRYGFFEYLFSKRNFKNYFLSYEAFILFIIFCIVVYDVNYFTSIAPNQPLLTKGFYPFHYTYLSVFLAYALATLTTFILYRYLVSRRPGKVKKFAKLSFACAVSITILFASYNSFVPHSLISHPYIKFLEVEEFVILRNKCYESYDKKRADLRVCRQVGSFLIRNERVQDSISYLEKACFAKLTDYRSCKLLTQVLLYHEEIEKCDYDLVLKALKLENKNKDYRTPLFYSKVAELHAERGDKKKAFEFINKAIAKEKDLENYKRYQKSKSMYENGLTYRTFNKLPCKR